MGPEHYVVVIVEVSQPLVAKISKSNKIELEAGSMVLVTSWEDPGVLGESPRLTI